MTANGSGLPSAATEGEARGFDQLGGSITPEYASIAGADQARLISTIKAHIVKGDKAAEKAEQHYIAAGQHLATLKKDHAGNWPEWEALLKTKIGISTGRASELMQIADGRKTVEQVRSGKAESMKRLRANVSSPRGEETSEPANGTKPPKHKSTSQDQRELEAVRAYAADLEAALEHDGDLAEKLREAEIRMAGMASEIEELKTAADAGADLIDRALNLVSRMSDAERAQFLVKVKQAYPPRRGRPRKRPQAEAEGSIMTAALDIPATLAPAHDSGDGLDIPECLKRVAP
jgi:hypothetical protein